MTEKWRSDIAPDALVVDSALQPKGMRGILFRNSLAQMTNVVVNGLTGLVLTRVIIEQLGLASYGLFSIALNAAIMFGVLANLGFSMLTVREMNRDPSKAAETFARLTATRAVISMGVLALAGAASYLLDYPAIVRSGLFLLALAIVLSGLTLQFGAYFQARLEAVKLTWSLLAGTIARFVFIVVFLLLLDGGLSSIFFGYIAGALVGLVVSVWLAREVIPAFGRSAFGISGLWSAAVLGLIIVLDVIHFRVDVLMLSALRAPEEVGAYGVAYRVFESLIMLGMAFAAAFYSVLTHAFGEGDIEAARRLIQRSFDGLAGISLGLVPLGIVGAPLAVLLLTGDSVPTSSDTLRVLMLCLPLLVTNPIFSLALVSLDRQNWIIAISCGAIVLNVLLNLFLIPQYGAVGAALATLVSEAFSLGAKFVLSVRVLDWRISLRQLLRYVTASGVTLIILLSVTSFAGSQPLSTIGVLTAGTLLYGILCLAFGAISWDEVRGFVRRFLLV